MGNGNVHIGASITMCPPARTDHTVAPRPVRGDFHGNHGRHTIGRVARLAKSARTHVDDDAIRLWPSGSPRALAAHTMRELGRWLPLTPVSHRETDQQRAHRVDNRTQRRIASHRIALAHPITR